MVSLCAPTTSNLNVHNRRLPAVDTAEWREGEQQHQWCVCVCVTEDGRSASGGRHTATTAYPVRKVALVRLTTMCRCTCKQR